MTTLRWKMRELMARNRTTNAIIAERLGVHPTTVSRWRSADVMPPLDGNQLEAIANVIGCSVAELLGLAADE